jgi:hypothetical protein
MVRTELSFRLPNSPGALAHVASLLASEHVRLLALCVEPSGTARIVADNPERALAALERQRMRVERRHVICSLVAPRSIASLLESVAAAGINLDCTYMSSSGDEGMLMLVLGVADAARASAAAGV